MHLGIGRRAGHAGKLDIIVDDDAVVDDRQTRFLLDDLAFASRGAEDYIVSLPLESGFAGIGQGCVLIVDGATVPESRYFPS